MFSEVVDKCKVGTLYPKLNITLLPEFFGFDQVGQDKYIADIMEADKLMKRFAFFREILENTNNENVLRKEWYLLLWFPISFWIQSSNPDS